MGLCVMLAKPVCRPVIMFQAQARACSGGRLKPPPAGLRHLKRREHLDRAVALGPHLACVQVVGAGSRDRGASLYVYATHNRYLFNCGEGTQRLMYENKMKLSHLDALFMTRMNWATVGGLPGMMLTLRDIGVPSIVMCGPPQLEQFVNTVTFYCGSLDNLKVNFHPHTEPVYKDLTMAVHQVPIFSDGTGSELPPSDPSLLNGGTSTGSPRSRAERGPPCVIAFVCKINDKKGNLLVNKGIEIGLPIGTPELGPLVSELKEGRSVMYQGKEIFPADVLSPSDPGPKFLVVECPTEDFLTPMTENETLKRYHAGNPDGEVALVVHMTPEHILNHSSYRHWMEQFGSGTEHLIMNESVSSVHSQSVSRIQTQLNLIHPHIFPQLPEHSRKEPAEKGIRGVQAEYSLKYQLRPTKEWQRDMINTTNTEEFVKEAMELPGFQEALRKCKTFLDSILLAAGVDAQYPEVVFLGTGSAIPMKTRNVSSTLVHVSSSKVLLLDCGEGTFNQLYCHYGADKVDDILCQLSAVFVSHIHADHHMGLIHVLHERERALFSRGKPFSPIILVGPDILLSWLDQFHNQFQEILHCIRFISSSKLTGAKEIACPNTKSLLSSLLETYQLDKFQTCHVRHCKNAYGCAVVHKSGWKVVFSGDTMPSDALIKIGKDATLLIHEATLEDGLEEEALEKSHSTTSQAITVGHKMNAKYIMLNHFSQRYSKVPLIDDGVIRKVGISFDHMRVRWSDFKILPNLMEPLKVLFAQHLIDLEERRGRRERSQLDVKPSASSKRNQEKGAEVDQFKRAKLS